MTNGDPLSNPEPAAAVPTAAPKSAGVVEWFWRGSKLKQAQLASHQPNEGEAVFAQRARASAQIAQQVLMPDEPLEMPAEGSAAELFRQSAYWSLCALSTPAFETARNDHDAAVWDSLDESVLTQSAEGEDRIEPLRAALRAGSFTYFAELPEAEQTALALELRAVAQALLARLGQRGQVLDAIYWQRTWRLTALAALVLGLVGSGLALRQVLENRSDLAVGAAWVASSKYDASACTSPAQQCAGASGFFFHTNEESHPWIEFDLQKNRDVSRVQVDNRTDCCAERADPLIIETSTDHRHWKSVAHHDGEFATWTATFKTVQARWVRVRVNKTTYLHLSKVRIFG